MRHHFNETIAQLCGGDSINTYITNLTSSYTDKSNEASMVSASVIMFVLAGLFFNLNLFSGLSDVSAILDPKVRLVLTSALSLFLPVMSYLFSEAKNAGAAMESYSGSTTGAVKDFSLRAGLILIWMLLVELLRKKVDDISMRGYSGIIQRAGRVAWLGSLVFFNIQSAGRKAVFAVLWILCATKVVQRIAYAEVGKRSYVHGKNARLIASYMAQTLKADDGQEIGATAIDVEGASPSLSGEELLKRCNYIVTGEDMMVKEATEDGYDLDLDNNSGHNTVVTVGKIWMLGDGDNAIGLRLMADHDADQRLRRLCLSFALFKLLRRRFEQHAEVTTEEARDCKKLILRGLCRCRNGEGSEEALFQVMNDELNFLCEYYHSVVPVVLASPIFFLANYFLLPVVVLVLCLMTVILCGNGDIGFAFHSIRTDNFALRSGLSNLAICLISRANSSPPTFFALVDVSITCLLFIIFFYEEIWEFLVFSLSNWFMISLIGKYTSKLTWRKSPSISGTFRRLIWLRGKMSHGSLCFRQFSVLNLRWPAIFVVPTSLALMVRSVPVPTKVKHSIKEYLLAHEHGAYRLTNGKSALEMNGVFGHLSWACESKSVAEVILTWHIATSLFEEWCQCHSKDGAAASHNVVASTLSRYCAYLVAFHPELLPGNQEKAERVFEAVKLELKEKLGCREYYVSRRRTRVKNIMKSTEKQGVVKNGATLAIALEAMATDDQGAVWKVLDDVWTELIIYVAPSSDEETVKGHENVLVQGGEFITMLWALATHIGVSRQASGNGPGVHPPG